MKPAHRFAIVLMSGAISFSAGLAQAYPQAQPAQPPVAQEQGPSAMPPSVSGGDSSGAVSKGAAKESAQRSAKQSMEALALMPVQDAGRLKPFETLARESLQLVYGKQDYKTSAGEKRSALEIVMTWMLVPQYWDTQKIVQINHKGLKDSLRLADAEKYFTPAELFANDRIGLVFQELGGFRERKEKLTPYYQAVQRLESQLGTYQAFKQGAAMRVAPPSLEEIQAAAGTTIPGEPEKWVTVNELKGDLQAKFALVIRSFIQALPRDAAVNQNGEVSTDGFVPPLADAVADFKVAARTQNPSLYPSDFDMKIEVHLKNLHPFLMSWILYLLAAVLLGISWQLDKKSFYRAAWVVLIGAFIMHNYGFLLRMYITGRPPVSNMYESVVWVSWGAIIFAMIFEVLYKRRFILMSGAIVGTLCLIVADLAPDVLDRSLQPLEPVLRSNMWLTVHVLTITLSYSAFFLAWGLGNLGLAFILKGDKPTSERMKILVQSLYRSIQVGVVLLAAGTILGGVWADYSWGRFWGWDPKETWALIAILGYLAMLHGRLVGWVKNFGMLVSAIVSFNLVIMAWYGVNYVLGAGLHSYGFGAGGVQYVSAFVFFNLVFVGYVAYVNHSRQPGRAVKASVAD
jgi:cytochrome c-type biogenesis protein CcsB